MTEEFELHRFCDGIDCSWCGIPESCIYKIANRLQTQLKEIKEENEKIKEVLKDIKQIVKDMDNECFYSDFDCKYCDMKNGCTYDRKIKILQKISEIENETKTDN